MMKPDRESRIETDRELDRELNLDRELKLIFDEEKHLYYVQRGENTEHIPSVTKILQKVGIYNYRKGEESLRRMKRGSHIHKLTEYLDLGDDEALAVLAKQDDLPHVVAWEHFKKEQRFIVSDIERRFFHSFYWFAGTIDRIGEIGGDTVLIDIKTGVPHPANKLQVSAYAILAEDHNIQVDRAMCVYLGDEDYHIEEVDSILKHWKAFQGALEVYRWMGENTGYKIIPKEV